MGFLTRYSTDCDDANRVMSKAETTAFLKWMEVVCRSINLVDCKTLHWLCAGMVDFNYFHLVSQYFLVGWLASIVVMSQAAPPGLEGLWDRFVWNTDICRWGPPSARCHNLSLLLIHKLPDISVFWSHPELVKWTTGSDAHCPSVPNGTIVGSQLRLIY